VLRTFVALDLDEHFMGEMAALGESLRGHPRLGRVRSRWVATSLMHVTLRFFGSTEEARVPELEALVRALGAEQPAFEVRAASLLAFPDARHARVLTVAIADDGACAAMANAAEAAARALGFEPEERPYRSHLTLARLHAPVDVRGVVAETTVAFVGEARSVTLYRSDTGQAGPVYTPLATCALG